MISREGTRNLPGDNRERKTAARPRFTAMLKRQFRELVKAITPKAPAPQPTQQRRRRGEETRGGFRQFARTLTRKVARSIFEDPTFWQLPDATDEAERIRQWEENNIDVDHSEDSESFHYAEQNHVSLNL